MSRVAVVILNYNGKELLKKFLPSVIKHSASARIIVADNNSSDGSRELLQAEFPQIEKIFLSSNLGFCGGYNAALANLEADYFVLLNSDVEVTENWLPPVIELFESDHTIGAAQPKILSYKDKHLFEYAGAGGGYIDSFGYPFCRGRVFHTIEPDEHQYDDTVPVFWATGACMFVRASLYKKLGGLDDDFFAHMEEIDLCWRLKRGGHKIMYQGKSAVYHVGGATLSASNSRKTYFNFRNGLMLLAKNLSPVQLFTRIPMRIFLDWVAALQFLFSGKPGDFGAVVRAHLYVITHIVSLYKKRSSVRAILPSYEVSDAYPGSIVVAYFLRGKKLFKDLPS